MDPKRWRNIEKLYESVVERSPTERAALLAQADADIRAEVEVLLAQPSGDALLDQPTEDLLGESGGTTQTELGPGAQLGPYRIEASLGAGGMGVVYRARDTRLDRPVAIKICAKQFSRRFALEAHAISRLNHPHICTLYDVGPNYLVMEFVEGATLAACLRKGALPLKHVLRYGAAISDALAAAHSAGIIHRDVKPSNIIIGSGDRAKVLDFGLAKLAVTNLDEDHPSPKFNSATEEGMIMGTLPYMSPEQAQGEQIDTRSDIFSFGAVMYEMLAGSPPFKAPTKLALLTAIVHQEPKPLREIVAGVPPELERIISLCLRKDPAKRYQHIEDVKIALEALREDSDSGSPGVAVPPRRPRLLAAIAVVSLAVILCLVAVLWRVQSRATGRENPLAGAQFTRLTRRP